MKKRQILVIAATIALYACSGGFSKGVKKDLSTGLSTSWNGFAVDDVYLTVDDSKLSSNKVTLGKVVKIIANGVGNHKVKEGRVFPGCSILLTDKNGKELLNLADAFADIKDGFESDKAGMLTATLNTGTPMVVGQTYHLKTRFYDKLNKESEIVSNVDLVMND